MRSPIVRSVMTDNVISIRPDTAFKTMVELLTKHRISAVPVIDDAGRPVGVVSEADLMSKEEFEGGTDPVPLLAGRDRRRRWHQSTGRKAADLMSRKVVTVGIDETVAAAARKLAVSGVRRLFVTDGTGRLVGVLSRRDVLALYLRSDEQLADEIRGNVLEGAMWIQEGVEVGVQEGVVTLTGTLPRRSEADIVARLTQAQPGVVGVVDHLNYEFDDVAAAGTGAV